MTTKLLKNYFFILLLSILYTLSAYCNNTNLQEVTVLADLKIAVQDAKLLPDPNGTGGRYANFGTSISIDGNRALVGSPNAVGMSAVYVFEYINDLWVKTAVIKTDSGDTYGMSVSLSGDRAVIGVPYSNTVDVYELQDDSWVKTARLTQEDVSGFGSSISVFGDRILVGVHTLPNNYFGTAYVYDLLNGVWSLSKKLSSQDISTDSQFLNTVSLSNDFAVVGEAYENNRSGAVYVYQFRNQEWQDYTKLSASDADLNGLFGSSLTISNNKLVITSPGKELTNKEKGVAYVFEYIDESWIETAQLSVDKEARGSKFGVSVDIEDNRVLVGSFSNISSNYGSAYVFDKDSGSWSLTQKLSPNDVNAGRAFGASVSLANGHILIGNKDDSQQASLSGAIYSFETNNNIVTQKQKIFAEGATFFAFAQAVSIDGNRALIGAMGDERDSHRGGAYIYDKIQGEWTLTTLLKPSTPDDPEIVGLSVSIFGDRAMVSATSSYTNSGSVYVFDLVNGQWSQSSRIIIDESDFSGSFGNSIDLQNNRVVIADSYDDEFAENSGAVYVYELIDGSWTKIVKLKSNNPLISGNFGSSVSLSGDRVLIGANGNGTGSAYVFDLIDGEWIESQQLSANQINFDGNFGISVSLDSDVALIGANQDSENGYHSGSAFVFERIDNNWLETGKLVASDGVADDSFGVSVSLSNNIALIGSSGKFNSAATGSGYLFSKTDGTWLEKIKLNASDKKSGDEFGFAVSLSGNNALVGSYRDDDKGIDSGSAYIYNLAPQASEIRAEHTALWHNTEQNGHGISVYMLENNRMLAIWYIYDNEGHPLWLLGTGTHDGKHATLDVVTTSGTMFPPNFNANDVNLVEWGQFEFEFYDCNQALFKWFPSNTNFTTGELNVVRLNHTLGLECDDLTSNNQVNNTIKINKSGENTIKPSHSALWFNADQSGHGLNVYLLDNNRVLCLWFVYDNQGKPIWLLGTGEFYGNNATLDVIITDGGIFPPDYNSENVNLNNWGTFELEFNSCDLGLFKWTPNDLTEFSSGEMDITRLTTTLGLSCQE